MKHFVTIFRK